jgi:hypothetical protein
MTKLNQIVAVRQGVQSRTHTAITAIHHNTQKSPLLAGLSRTYEPKDEMGDRHPAESTRVQVRTHELVNDFARHLVDLFDVTATLDYGNCTAKGNIVVDGQTILSDVPVTYLMFLEKQLTDVRTFFQKLQTLDPSENWQWDANNEWWKSEPVGRNSTKKVLRNHVKAKATDRHPEQVDVYTEDVVVGTWTTTKFSGALPERERAALVDRVHKLQDAVKHAREQANSTDVQQTKVGERVFSYLLSGT